MAKAGFKHRKYHKKYIFQILFKENIRKSEI